MSIFDTLVTDPTQEDGGLFARILGVKPASNPNAMFSYMPGTPHGLFGASPLGNMIRGGLGGLAGSAGYRGLAALGQGAMAGAAANQRYDQTMVPNARFVQLLRQLMLMQKAGLGPNPAALTPDQGSSGTP